MKTGAMNVKEVADMLQVSPSTIRKWCNNGMLKHFRLPLGKRPRRFTRNDVLKFANLNGMSVRD